jgi:GH25 family lysozyme M1 (1,4-beta-N-acetylmuramidase)
MKFSMFRKSAGVFCAAVLGCTVFCPVMSASALETKSTKTKLPVNPEEITHNSRFDSYQKLDCIDVSVYQSKIDWTAVAAEGVDAAIVRAGYRSYDKGEIKGDKYFISNLQNAYNAGLQVGVYFYTQAVNTDEAKEEAQYVLDMLSTAKDVILSLPVYVDMEHVDNDKGRLDELKLSPAEHTEIVDAFCDVIEAGAYRAGVYSSRSFMEDHLNMAALEDRSVWMASCGEKTSYKGRYDIWQYSHRSRINGIKGTVDRSVLYTLDTAETAQSSVTVRPFEPEIEECEVLPNPDFSVIQFATESVDEFVTAD